ncbi:hypothetical protein ABT093_39055 [Kitasatospora sp. NPDC002551]|uniref:hypothetical protein n=1 Tax=Kitasatospora sp. NPDC002551 TaxID=3154539 RepID=UPI0033322D09
MSYRHPAREQIRIEHVLTALGNPPQAAEGLAVLFGVERDVVEAAHAASVAVQASRPAPLVLEGALLEGLAGHFGMAPEDLLHLAQCLAAGEGGESR